MAINLAPYVNDELSIKIRDLMNEGSLLANSYIDIHTDPKPSSPIEAPVGVKLATIYLPDPAVSGPVDQVLTVEFVGIVSNVIAQGKASWFRFYNKDKTTIFDGTIVKNGSVGDIKLKEVDLFVGQNIQLSNVQLMFKCST